MYQLSTTTRLGYMRAISSGSGLKLLEWQQTPFDKPDMPDHVSRETISQLKAYLDGQLEQFSIPLDLALISTKLKGWLITLQTIPYGQTVTYADFAEKWGNRKAARAAGDACRRNPIPIIIPCHRVIKSDGSFDNYSGGDNTHPSDPENIKRKQWLIQMETTNLPRL